MGYLAGLKEYLDEGYTNSIFDQALDGRDYMVIGIPMLMGGVVSILPEAFFEAFPSTVHALLKSGLVVGIVLVLALEHLLLPRN